MVTQTLERPAVAPLTLESARRLIKRWVDERIAGEDELSLPALADEALEHFQRDPALVALLFSETFKSMFVQIANQAVASTRQKRYIVQGSKIRSYRRAADVLQERAEQFEKDFGKLSGWYERVGEKRHLRVPLMTRNDLLAAAAYRRNNSETEMAYAVLWERLAQGIDADNPDLTVRDVYAPEDVERAHNEVARSLKITLDTLFA